VGLASIDYYQKAKIPLVVAVSTGPALTRKFSPPAQKVNFIFRVSPTLDLEAKVLAADLKKRGLIRIALLADTTPYGDSGVAAFAEQARLAGLDVVGEFRFKVGDTDMSGLIKRARTAGASALVVWGIGPELAHIARGVQATGWRVPLLGSWTLSMRNFIDAAGPAGDGALMPQTFIQDAGSTTKNSFLLAYHRAFKSDLIPSPMSAAQGYDGMHILAHAIRQSKTLDGDAIRTSLENLNFRYQGVVTSYERPFSAQDHDAITTNMIVLGKVSNGRVDYAYSEDQQRSAILRVKRNSN
jgi:branched-chain amino acid transport system substrate-binding protein